MVMGIGYVPQLRSMSLITIRIIQLTPNFGLKSKRAGAAPDLTKTGTLERLLIALFQVFNFSSAAGRKRRQIPTLDWRRETWRSPRSRRSQATGVTSMTAKFPVSSPVGRRPVRVCERCRPGHRPAAWHGLPAPMSVRRSSL